ncbi:MAG: bacteriohemerythrin [Syntrophobacteraceae bacterium]|jgi:hemerythrin|nr:bacteriohemerythrin [Syntrophobacteraceae bacterium]
MSSFVWNEKYRVNVKDLDDQHRVLIGLVGQLDDAMREGKGKQALGLILGQVIAYTKTHFAAEERLMKACGYPEYHEHRLIHEKMTTKVVELEQQFKSGRAMLTLDVMKFLTDWLQKHILGTDKKYSPFLGSPSSN